MPTINVKLRNKDGEPVAIVPVEQADLREAQMVRYQGTYYNYEYSDGMGGAYREPIYREVDPPVEIG